jgi:Tfp pilus assembly protein PilX
MKKKFRRGVPVRRRLRGESGQLLVAAVAALLIVSIFVPMIVQYLNRESRWAEKQKRTTNAFHLAEAGVDRGLWWLTEAEENWTAAKNGSALPAAYSDGVEHADVRGGVYKISIGSGPSSGEVTIRAKGRDTSTDEIRAVEAVYTKASINAGLTVDGGLTYRPNLHVHWGPVVNYTSIDQSPTDYFPRKYSKGPITGRDTVNDSVNTDNVEYWAFNPDLGDPPQIDFDYYKTKAQNSQVPLASVSPSGNININMGGSTPAVASPAGSGYFLASQNSNKGLKFVKSGGGSNHYKFASSTSVIYIDNDYSGAIITDLQNGGCFLQVEALILAGANHQADINAQEGVVVATVPAAAQTEYMHASAAATWAGFAPAGSNYTLDKLAVHGFMYVGGNVTNAGSNTQILGALDVHGNVNVNTLNVYYDPKVAENIKLKAGSPRRISWKEVKVPW